MTNKPEGFSTLSPVIISKDAMATVEDYQKALGAEISCPAMECGKTGKIEHVGLKIGDATLLISDEFPEVNILATGLQQFFLYVENADNAFGQAKSAGWEVMSDPEDMFWGDRVSALKDKSGNTWKLAQKVRDVSPEEIEEVMKKMGEAA